ncbi:MAG: hypothetical protein JSV19_08365 [Phycisphaerales bacterium]|nr:MAG: hypothetical protein JSV19_08365 [Phycisphaerales bacterium]
MRNNLLKKVALVVSGGVVLGCIPCCPCGGNPCSWLTGAVSSLAVEFLTDNDAVFDLFQDDFGTGALYDDRFTAAPTRGEQEGSNVANLGAGG